jgi:hypothetical protein
MRPRDFSRRPSDLNTPFLPVSAFFRALIAGCAAAAPIAAQVSYNPDFAVSQAQRALPADGLAASQFNPAALGESPKVYGHFGIAASDLGPFLCWQVAGSMMEEGSGLPIRIAAGLGGWSTNLQTDGTNAVSEESRIIPGLAVAWPTGAAGLPFLSLGLAFPIHTYNAFSAIKSRSVSLGLGMLSEFAPGGSSLQAGIAFHNLMQPMVQFPDGRGQYAIGDWGSVSLAWAPPGRWARLHWEWYLPDVRRENLILHFQDIRVNAWELEWRPHPKAGLKFERTRGGDLSSWGLVLRPEGGRMKAVYLEVNAGHDRLQPSGPAWLFGNTAAARSGAHAGLSLGAGM